MEDIKTVPVAGYSLQRIYVFEQHYQIRGEFEIEELQPEPTISFLWDWRVAGERSFDVMISAEIGPSRERREEIKVTLIGSFKADSGETVGFRTFVQQNAVAILFPYLRENLSSLSARGPFGMAILPPMNVVAIASEFDFSASTGAQQMQEDVELADLFDIATAE